MSFDLDVLRHMTHSTIHNYVLTGLSSSLIGGPGKGKVRLFQQDRNQQDSITPHSHRFDFLCCVLHGSVHNKVWTRGSSNVADEYCTTTLYYQGEVGKYTTETESRTALWSFHDTQYNAGECYSMKAHEVHSICFSKGAVVLFLEGPPINDYSVIIEPVVKGVRIPTFEVKPWMFTRD